MKDPIWDDMLHHSCEHVRREAARRLGQRWAEEAINEIKRRLERIK
jgi:hypothetical protein